MDRIAITGLALAIAGAVGIIAAETIGTAHAGRTTDKVFLVAVSSGSALRLMPQRSAAVPAMPAISANERRLDCARVVEVTAVSLGFRCRAE